ncbi:MAG: hypothetical protein A3D38_01115 [Candidatus Portnoybacteria bacterium RIFCSPHIGHO2_02_FULL_40_23]|nr:MAG: hypothetical protein A3D38_01115 [Candidatus Portnoybacteria bacterium RIFCSPHIGHO2_02_FULL_40_23]
MIFEPKVPFNLVAEPRKRGEANLTFPRWLRILKIVRTHFASPWRGGENDKPPKISFERLRRDLKNCQRTR